MRPEIERVVAQLISDSEDGRAVSLDAIGEALGHRAVTTDEIDELIGRLETAGRRVGEEQSGPGEAHLQKVVAAARALRSELGRSATAEEIAVRAAIPLSAVRHALALAKVMQR